MMALPQGCRRSSPWMGSKSAAKSSERIGNEREARTHLIEFLELVALLLAAVAADGRHVEHPVAELHKRTAAMIAERHPNQARHMSGGLPEHARVSAALEIAVRKGRSRDDKSAEETALCTRLRGGEGGAAHTA